MSEVNATVETLEDDQMLSLPETVAAFIEMVDEYNLQATAKLGTVLSDEGLISAAEQIVDAMQDSDEALYDALYYLFDYSGETRTFQELLEMSEYQSQFGINATSLVKILADPQTGLLTVNAMIEPMKVLKTTEGEERLAGGHNRLGALALLFIRSAGGDWSDLLVQKLPITLFQVNRGLTAPERAIASTVLWFSDNGSRSTTSAEKSSYKMTRLNVSLSNADSILNNDAITDRDRVVLYGLHIAKREGLLEDRNGHVSRRVVFQDGGSVETSTAILKAETLRAILSSFLSHILRIKESDEKKAKARWKADFSSPRALKAHMESIFAIDTRVNLSLLDLAVKETVKRLREAGSDTATNIAYNKSSHGETLAALFDATFTPVNATVTGKTKKVTSLGRRL